MCVIAGYAGNERAAGKLIAMMRRIEGLAGGFYTGIATVEGRSLHCRKVVGDLDWLLENTDAAELAGGFGVAHARPKMEGGYEWGHPFVACDNSLAYIANGAHGKYKGDPRYKKYARLLESEGHKFRALSPTKIGDTPELSDGDFVHTSEVMAHLIEDRLARTGSPEKAIERAFLDMPAEIVGLFVAPAFPARVYGARWDMPACVALDDDGAYVASSPEAFPETVKWWTWVPPSTVFSIGRDGVRFAPLGKPADAIAKDIDPCEARAKVLEAIREEGGLHVEKLLELMPPLSRAEPPVVRYDPVYQALYDLMRSGAIRRRVVHVEGYEKGGRGTRFLHDPAD